MCVRNWDRRWAVAGKVYCTVCGIVEGGRQGGKLVLHAHMDGQSRGVTDICTVPWDVCVRDCVCACVWLCACGVPDVGQQGGEAILQGVKG